MWKWWTLPSIRVYNLQYLPLNTNYLKKMKIIIKIHKKHNNLVMLYNNWFHMFFSSSFFLKKWKWNKKFKHSKTYYTYICFASCLLIYSTQFMVYRNFSFYFVASPLPIDRLVGRTVNRSIHWIELVVRSGGTHSSANAFFYWFLSSICVFRLLFININYVAWNWMGCVCDGLDF